MATNEPEVTVTREHRRRAVIEWGWGLYVSVEEWVLQGIDEKIQINQARIELPRVARLIADAEARGAERMREAAASECDSLAHEADSVNDAHAACWAEEVAKRIRRLKVTP